MAKTDDAVKGHKKLFKRLSKQFDGKPGLRAPGKSEAKAAKKANVEVLAYVERGSFSHGACAGCGWQGPGRRARAKATDDYLAHAKDCKKASKR